jgi:hypothetical protein
MTRRLAGWLLLLLMASSGAYALAEPRVSQGIRVEFAIACRENAEVPAERTASGGYPSEPPSWYSTDSPRVRAGIERALYQRPPPASR